MHTIHKCSFDLQYNNSDEPLNFKKFFIILFNCFRAIKELFYAQNMKILRTTKLKEKYLVLIKNMYFKNPLLYPPQLPSICPSRDISS